MKFAFALLSGLAALPLAVLTVERAGAVPPVAAPAPYKTELPKTELVNDAAPMSRPASGLELPVAAEGYRAPDAEQVRIEQRITIRVSPRPLPMPVMRNMIVEEDDASGGPRFIERKIGRCLPLSVVAGVQPGPDNKLVLLLRDNRLISASLDKNCNSRDFYSGFLVERNSDGMICIGRDSLLSRSGVSCRIHGLRQLIVADN